MRQKRYEDLLAAGAPKLDIGWFYEIRKWAGEEDDSVFKYEVVLYEGDEEFDSSLITKLTVDDIVNGCKAVVSKRKHDLERKRREEEWLGRF